MVTLNSLLHAHIDVHMRHQRLFPATDHFWLYNTAKPWYQKCLLEMPKANFYFFFSPVLYVYFMIRAYISSTLQSSPLTD